MAESTPSSSPGILDWLTSPLKSLTSMFTGASSAGGGLIDGIENMAENHPTLTGGAIALADHEINGTGILGSLFTWYAANDVLQGKATGLFGLVEKVWLANEFKDAVETEGSKMGLGNGLMDTLAGWAGGFFAFEGMGSLEDKINAKKNAPAPAAHPAPA